MFAFVVLALDSGLCGIVLGAGISSKVAFGLLSVVFLVDEWISRDSWTSQAGMALCHPRDFCQEQIAPNMHSSACSGGRLLLAIIICTIGVSFCTLFLYIPLISFRVSLSFCVGRLVSTFTSSLPQSSRRKDADGIDLYRS